MMMFKELTNFGLRRTLVQALGFYLAYLLVIMVIGGLAGLALGLIFYDTESVGFEQGLGVGAVAGALACAYLTYTILKQKHSTKSFSTIVYILITLGLGLLGGGLLGLLIPTYLTTKDLLA